MGPVFPEREHLEKWDLSYSANCMTSKNAFAGDAQGFQPQPLPGWCLAGAPCPSLLR